VPKPSINALFRLSVRHPRYFSHLIRKKAGFLRRMRWLTNNPGKDGQVPPPLVYKFMLTTNCNLHCKSCMLWGEVGWCVKRRDKHEKENIEWDVLEKTISRIAGGRPNLIFTGGEPLLYPSFADLMGLIKREKCFSIVNTNGTLLDRYADVFNDNPYATLLVSLDGLSEENDLLRGPGVYDKVVKNIKTILSLEKPPYVGVQFTITPENVHVMHAFCKRMAGLGVDWILLNPCWFITEEEAEKHEKFMVERFHVAPKTHRGFMFNYDLDTQKFIAEYGKIAAERWPIQVSCYLKDPEKDIIGYVGSDSPSDCFCFQQWVRINVLPSGQVTPCALYPDLTFGDIKTTDILEIWNSKGFAEFRRTVREKSLPVCSKCDCLYLYDLRRRYL
jgi:MoaA/NifB/PqqE/SkfB family radical SAM enzyme